MNVFIRPPRPTPPPPPLLNQWFPSQSKLINYLVRSTRLALEDTPPAEEVLRGCWLVGEGKERGEWQDEEGTREEERKMKKQG